MIYEIVSTEHHRHTIEVLSQDILSNSWLENKLGFQSTLIASDFIGAILLKMFSQSDLKGLTAYVVEQALMTVYHRSPIVLSSWRGLVRDRHMSRFFSVTCTSSGINSSVIPGLDAKANVELCSMIMQHREELNEIDNIFGSANCESVSSRRSTKSNTNMISKKNKELYSSNSQLEEWLTKWMGKLSMHLNRETSLPLFLTFPHAKLFMNLYPVQKFSSDDFLQHPEI